MEYIFKSLYVRSELCVCDKLYELFLFVTFSTYQAFKDYEGRKKWILKQNIFRFGKVFGICTNSIMVFQLMMSRSGKSWTRNVSRLIRNMQDDQDKSSCNRCFWRWLQSWKGARSMGNRTRAQPEHRLDRFTQWSRDIIANNKRKSGTGSPLQRTELTSKKRREEVRK